MLGICREKVKISMTRGALTLALLVSGLFQANAQSRNNIIHQAEYDAKQVHFGYFMGVAMSNYRIRHNESFNSVANDTIKSITSPIDYGLKMGGLMNFYVNDRFDVKFVPTVAIYSRKLTVNENPDIIPSREQAWFEIPVFLKYKSLRRGNTRMNMFVGLRQGFETNAINLARRGRINRVEGLRRGDFSVEYGAGMELFRQFFKLAPEVHFSHGLRNMIDRADITSTDPTPLSVLGRLNTHTVTFYLFFE
jgi:hypothetical protein